MHDRTEVALAPVNGPAAAAAAATAILPTLYLAS